MESQHTYHHSLVCFDGWNDETETFSCLLPAGEKWNGFACPFFTKEVADKVAEFFRREPFNNIVTFDAARDEYTYQIPDVHTLEVMAIETFGSVQIHGTTYYAIGAWDWTWIEVEKE